MTSQTIPATQIQSELKRIWDSLESKGKMRASVFNLIFYVQNEQRLDYFRKIAQKVIERFPSRVMLISTDKTPKSDYLNAKVSVLSVQEHQYDVFCDFIELQVTTSQENRVPFVILPHILPDLPIYVVWGEDPCIEDPISRELEKMATRMIFDSESTGDLPLFAQALLNRMKQCKCDIADLNWARMENWRDLFAATFHSKDRLAELENAKTIQICYNVLETAFFCHTHIQAIYLQGWLAGQLGWQFEKMEKTQPNVLSLSYSTKNRKITVLLKAQAYDKLVPGTIVSVDFVTNKEEHFSFCRNPQIPNHIMMNISSPEKCELPTQFIFPKGERGQSLVKEICYKGTSTHYVNLLNHLSKMDFPKQC